MHCTQASGLKTALTALSMAALASSVHAQGDSCTHVTAEKLGIAGLALTGSKTMEAANGLPAHCLLTGKVHDRTGSDGKHYAIHFEIRLPAEWNGRFLHQVNGGNDGTVVPALGVRADGLAAGGKTALARGFAVLSSDSGHSGSDPANKDFGIASGAAFGLDAQARRDYGYSADLTLSPIAKAIIEAHYGHKLSYSYMFGCSNGGRHAMVMASRRPDFYDGYLVGNPGFDLPRAAIQHAWDVRLLASLDPDIRKSITREDAKLISSKIIEACDALDGARDGITANLAACQRTFDFKRLQCTPGETNACLSEAKVKVLKAMFAGPHDSKGQALYSDWPIDGGVGTGNWRFWKVESPISAWGHHSAIATMGAASLAYIFTTPPSKVQGTNEALIESLLKFDFDRDAPLIYAKDASYPESAMEFMTPPDVDNPKLAGFAGTRRKMILFHGQADPVFSLNDTIRWYRKLDANLDGKAADFARLFAMPGVTHCGGGIGLDRFDTLSALTDWVENGVAPDRITASADPANKEIPPSWSPARTRPLCPWPKYARYKGGDIEKESSFECASP
ncbi:tannase/feruloyl esterase family alpha/beta hydrolase [Reyranella sp.]|jgi:feruloyl esterase|uniref:tannase/feruloyl esterase family alpha/beta hydrolase n=1 Tax=Reyranella sp. TaxID=1929291 RepID=UPI002F932A8C